MRKRYTKLTYRCWYCGTQLNKLTRTWDHVVARYLGGRDETSNFVFACYPCNQLKGHMTLEAFRTLWQQLTGRAQFYGETTTRPNDCLPVWRF